LHPMSMVAVYSRYLEHNMSINVRAKGKKGEYEWRDIINKTFGTHYARTPLSGGLELKGDLLKKYGAPKTIADEFHYEVKRVEKLNIHDAVRQAIRDARPPLIPCVPFRKSHEDWLICLRADDFLNILVELGELRKLADGVNETEFENYIRKKETKRRIKKELEDKYGKEGSLRPTKCRRVP